MSKHNRSRQMWRHAEQSLGGGVSTGLRRQMRPHPLFFDHGSGSRIWDVDGNEYVDYVLAWGPLILGHCPPAVVETMTAQLHRGTTFGSGHEWEFKAAEAVCAAMPGAERVLWSNTGTEAVQSALRLARAVTGREKVVKFEGHYHGWMDSVLVSYRHTNPQHTAEAETQGQEVGVLNDVVVVPWNDEGAIKSAMAEHGDEIAAVITEPVLCNSGVIPPRPGYLELLRELTDHGGSLLIFDEVITGFRIAYGGAAQLYGVTPDLRTLGKALGAGAPVAAIAGRADVIDLVTSGVVHAGTYNGNPLVLCAVAATMDELGKAGTFEALKTLGETLAAGFVEAFTRSATRFAVNQVGPVVQCAVGVDRLETYDDYASADWTVWDRIVVELLNEGVFALPGGRWYLSTAHTAADVETAVAAFANALQRVGV